MSVGGSSSSEEVEFVEEGGCSEERLRVRSRCRENVSRVEVMWSSLSSMLEGRDVGKLWVDVDGWRDSKRRVAAPVDSCKAVRRVELSMVGSVEVGGGNWVFSVSSTVLW